MLVQLAAAPLDKNAIVQKLVGIAHTDEEGIVHEQTAVAARSMTEIKVRFGPLCGLKSDISRGPRSADFVAEVGEERARCALAPTATHSVRAVALRGLR